MLRNIQVCLFVVMSLLLTILLGGCGSDNKAGIFTGGAARVADETTCRVCHSSSVDPSSGTLIVNDFVGGGPQALPPSVHFGPDPLGCQGCHGGGAEHNGVGPIPFPDPLAANRCILCHTAGGIAPPDAAFGNISAIFTVAKGGFVTNNCAHCHTATSVGSVHGALVPLTDSDCIFCHSVAAPRHGDLVGDNSGVRAITVEFAKWSHHVTGVTLSNAHCIACHMEGTVVDGVIIMDDSKHMVDNKVHLRDTSSNTDAEFLWDPMAPNFSGMDTFCLSCHDANGAVSPISVRIQAFINTNGLAAPGKTASPTNPFGDTISNQYDRLERPAVVNAKSQFNTSNPSHHAVLGKRYSGRTRAGVANPAGFTSNSSANLPGTRTTIFEAGKFEATYITLANAGGEINTPASLNGRNGGTTLGDDSTLHCGDCHTVGQYRAADAAPGNRYNKAVIGAHGSNNEYLLRNNLGTDERHTGAKFAGSGNFGSDLGFGNMPYVVCFNCHAFQTYGSAFGTSGAGHASEYDQDGRCNGAGQTINNVFGPVVGVDRLKTYNEDAAKYGQPDGNTFANMFGMECNNCHNSGINGNMFGGIHGAAEQTYIDGMGNTTKHARFFPGLGNAMFVPGVRGGFTGGTVATYTNYSGNRDGTGTGNTTGQTFTPLPVRNTLDATTLRGSYTYTTGGVGSDLNWEQKTQQVVAGITDQPSKAMGCYTLSPPGTIVVPQDGRLAATDGLQAGFPGPNGTNVMFDNWGGCDDHNNAQGAGTNFTRKVNRKLNY